MEVEKWARAYTRHRFYNMALGPHFGIPLKIGPPGAAAGTDGQRVRGAGPERPQNFKTKHGPKSLIEKFDNYNCHIGDFEANPARGASGVGVS